MNHPRAVYVLECAYDGAIPAADLAEARRLDAEFEAANPGWFQLSQAQRDMSHWRNRVALIADAKRAREKLSGFHRWHHDRDWEEIRRCHKDFRDALAIVRAQNVPAMRRAA